MAEEADEGLVAVVGELGGEGGGCGDGGDDGEAGGEGFLQDFEGGAAADEEEMVVEGEAVVEEAVAEGFVDGVVSADVFAENEQLAVDVEDGGGVEATGLLEGRLRFFEMLGGVQEGLSVDAAGGGDGGEVGVNGIDGGFAAQATA